MSRDLPASASQDSFAYLTLDSLCPPDFILRRTPPVPLVPRDPQPPSASSAFCGRRAAACRERSGWCPCASPPPRLASPPVSPLSPPPVASPSILHRPCGATLPAPCSGTPAVQGLDEARRQVRGRPSRA